MFNRMVIRMVIRMVKGKQAIKRIIVQLVWGINSCHNYA